jgi:hypothetical protein
MVGGIKSLIEKEREAGDQVSKAQAYKIDLINKARSDAAIAINMILEDQNKAIQIKELELKHHLEQFFEQKEKEYLEIEESMKSKNHSELISALSDIITGKTKK